MPTKFSQFFKLASEADDFQKRIYAVVSNATSIMDCYVRIYKYIAGGLRLRSKTDRKRFMNASVVIDHFDQQQMDDAQKYFEAEELTQWENRVLFEFFAMVPQDAEQYGPNVYILRFDESSKAMAQTACRQVQLYLQMQKYNREYDAQVEHFKKTKKPPNRKIVIDPATKKGRVDPDSSDQKNQLTKFVDDLVKWIHETYPDVQTLLAVKTPTDFYKLVFSGNNDELTIQALQTMLNSIRDLKDSRPASTRKAFRLWVAKETKLKEKFWKNEKISAAYEPIQKFADTTNLKLYGFMMTLFTDFLNPNAYPSETNAQARKRRLEALTNIWAIFSKFSNKQPIQGKFTSMMEAALQKVQKAYPQRYTSNLEQAKEPIPENNKVNTVLPEDLAGALKEKSDELLRTLPLLRGATKIRFFTVQNFADLQALNGDSVIAQNKSKSPVVVRSDPSENGVPNYRPIFRAGFRIGKAVERAIAFGNLPTNSGVFYYREVESPATAKVTAKNNSKRILTINFQNYTIEYEKKKNGKLKNDAGQAYRSMGSTVVFFDDIKKTTKWTQIKGGRRYDPYYSTIPTNGKLSEAHLTAYVAAARGAARALPLGDDSLCVWFWDFADASKRLLYGRLGEILGLPTGRQIIVTGSLAQLHDETSVTTVEIGGAQYKFVNYGLRQFRNTGFYYPIIGITASGKGEKFYVKVNTPSPSVADVLTTGTTKGKSHPLTDDPKSILALFNFSYYRRITAKPDVGNLPRVTEDSKVVQLYSKNDKRKPTGSGTALPWPDQNFDAVAANLPICFNLKQNVIKYFLDKQTRGKMINKGNPLFREQKPRQDAGTAMSSIFKKLKPPLSTELTPAKVPATAFANGAMRQSPAVQQDWGVLKIADFNYLPINQEWCHLRGHGDGGEEYPGNFVSGSYHCNTEQLAIETGQRLITQQMPERSFVLHTTAYLLRDATDYKSKVDDQRKSQVLTTNYLENETAYQDMLGNHLARRSRKQDVTNNQPAKNQKKPANARVIDTPALQQGAVAPVAAYIRYKVMQCKSKGTGSAGGKRPQTLTKFFDFIFEGQSEFIDKHQFAITSQAVQFALAGKAAFENWYEQAKAELDSKSV